MGANCYSAKNNEGLLCGGGRDKRGGIALSSLSEDLIKEYLCQDMELEDVDSLELCGIPMNAREVSQILSFAYPPDDVLYSLTRMSKSSLSFLSK